MPLLWFGSDNDFDDGDDGDFDDNGDDELIPFVNGDNLQAATKDCNLPGAKNLTCASKTWLAAHSDQGLGRQVHHTPQAAPPWSVPRCCLPLQVIMMIWLW